MNKAFVREPDPSGEPPCPRCGTLGIAVGPDTLRARLVPDALDQLTESGFFCSDPSCPVAYFDPFGRTVSIEALIRPVYPKDPNAPICACFGLGRDEIEQDVREGSVRRVREVVTKARSPEARCAIHAADGRPCTAEVQRYYMKLVGSQSTYGET